MAETLCQALHSLAEARGNTLAVVGARRSLTWAELEGEVAQIASALHAEGVRPGQRVGLMLPRVPELAVAFLALARVGAVVVPINHKLQLQWVVAQLEDIDFLVADPEPAKTLPADAAAGLRWMTPEQLGEVCTASQSTTFTSAPQTVCYLNCTSGSTGRPKRAVTTHAQILANARATVAASGQHADDVYWCLFAAFAHPHEFFHRSLVSGAAFVMIETMSPRVVAKAVAQHRVSHMLVLPGFAEIWNDSGFMAAAGVRLRRLEAGGSVVTPELHRRMSEGYSGEFVGVWGSTETTGVALVSAGEGGCVLDGYVIKVVDESGRLVPPGAVGELCVRGPAVVAEYSPAAEEANNPFGDGWFQTGDLVRQDEEQRVHFLGRRSSLMKVGGARVFPAEVERVLVAHPHVREAVVVGVSDRRRGEVPVALVVAAGKAEVDSLRRHCRSALAAYKVPRRIVFVDALPRLVGGKVDRAAALALVS